MTNNNDTPEKPLDDPLLKKIWENPFGKIVVISASALALTGLAGFSLKLATFAMNNYKDFRAAYKR